MQLIATLIIACASIAIGCSNPNTRSPALPSTDTRVPNATEWLGRQDVQNRFRDRSSAADYQRFRELTSDRMDSARQTMALELVLFKLHSDELLALGITQVEQPDGLDWSVAWSTDDDEVMRAVFAAFGKADVGGFASCGLGRAGWYVPRDQFFRARSALLESPDVAWLKVQVVSPRLGEP